ncbi:MAG: F0F1 ATP synthase subunit B [Proteobacteria bacterium]|nr:F0F1 ATP synthase subunit B [Pseudomonadota bacterium]
MTGRIRPGMPGAGMTGIVILTIAFLPGCAMVERITHDPWLSFAFKVVNFLILMAILFKFLSKPLGNFLKNRQAKVRQALEDAEKARAEAEKKMGEYDKRLARIDKEIGEIHRVLREEGENEKVRIIREAERMAENIKEQARSTAQQEIRQAQRILREEMTDLAVKMAEEILRKSISKSDQKMLVEEYVAKMETPS